MTKVISLSNEAYSELKKRKSEGESFSDVVMKMAGRPKRVSVMELKGSWVGPDLEQVERRILRERERAGRQWYS